MKKIIFHLAIGMSLIVGKAFAQETFETRAKKIAEKIETVTKAEKEALKVEIEAVNKQVESGTISKEQGDEKKKMLAENRALLIEKKVAIYQDELNQLVQDKVNGKIKSTNQADSTRVNVGELSIQFKKDFKEKKDIEYTEKRTTSQFVFAAGLNNVMIDGELQDSDFRFWGSHFYEWGLTYNTRLAKNDNLLHLKYGLSLMYNNLRPTDNRQFEEAGDQTYLVESDVNLKDSRFRNVYLVAPLHFEFDFSGKTTVNDKEYFKSHKSLRMGFGGYAGVRVKSKQILKYEIDDNDVRERIRGDFNSSNFIYGLSSYIGYKEVSLYVKYDLNPLFRNNVVKQNNVSLGVRFDFN